jgi:hypothetical protein
MLLFAERLTIPELVARVPRTGVLWTVSAAAALSLVLILYVPSIAELFRVTPPAIGSVGIALILGILSIGWRLMISGPP